MDVAPKFRRRRARRVATAAVALAGLGIGLTVTAASGTPGNGKPEMQVLPKTTGLNYGQTVRIKGDDLPKGSGQIAATICGFTDGSGKQISSPTADDCAGVESIGKLVILQENKDGTYDQPYTLPASGQVFGKNQRKCDKTHYCALVLADANPDAPAYYIPTLIYFADQNAPAGGGTPTTAPPKPKANASSDEVTVGETVDVSGQNWDKSDKNTTVGFIDANGAPTSAPVKAKVNSKGAFKVTLTPQFDDIDATKLLVVDPSGNRKDHRITIPIDVHPQDGVSGVARGTVHIDQEDPTQSSAQVNARVVVTPPANEGGPLPPEVAEPLDNGCAQLAEQLSSAGADTLALTTVCNSLVNGGGGDQLQLLLQNPTALCIALGGAAGNAPEFIDGCNQILGGAQPATQPLGDALQPLTDAIP